MVEHSDNKERPYALKGLKICDFTWIIAGALITTCLGEHGAEVIKVESITRPDGFRVYAPYKDGISGVNRSGVFTAINNSKYSIALNLKHPRGLEIVKKLVAWSDVVVENFAAGVMEKMGLGYDALKEVKSDIIMVSCSMQGQSGPNSQQAGFGNLANALGGISHLIGWPDRAPVGLVVAYTDFMVPFYAISAIMAAVDYHHRTGEGQYIDLSQYESSVNFLAPAVLDYTVNKRVQIGMGNRSPSSVPHGVYRCKGNNRWCAIAVTSDEEWEAFCHVINADWQNNPKFSTFIERKKNEDELDSLLEEWAIEHSPEQVMEIMQAAGVSATVVANGQDIQDDPQLRHRNHYRVLDHPEMGPTIHEGLSFRLSRTPSEVQMPAPCLGEHTEYICTNILEMSEEEFIEYLNAGVFE